MAESNYEFTIDVEIVEAIEARDEPRLKRAILAAMRMFLDGKLSKFGLEGLALYHIDIPAEKKWRRPLRFADPKLEHVFTKLSSISRASNTQAKASVQRYIAILEGPERERLECVDGKREG